MIIKWNPSISVGDVTIDAQHKKLLAQINSLLEVLKTNESAAIISEAVEFLDKYIIEHLEHEEVYMQEHKYSGYSQHKAIHNHFRQQYKEFKIELGKGESAQLAIKVHNFLGNWWLNHIATEDHKYYEFINSHPSSHPTKEPEKYHQTVQTLETS